MELSRATEGTLTLALSEQELCVIHACLQESLTVIHPWEYRHMVGVPVETASGIAGRLHHLMRVIGIVDGHV
ncbi:hypothetical protein GCM10011505_25010 [Tistrella bauzanensis]|uniref:Uncharacterized protein n=1 Tax=Tistrella bauzanensis TaxID=657419 RepID=A0ABQ1II21_9PROT|nr:hypothetical protein [Tistrella bauzanensis]GGB42613.1 hypothetical protein GCM10011505_25010 [Tistrella bauzanensis]